MTGRRESRGLREDEWGRCVSIPSVSSFCWIFFSSQLVCFLAGLLKCLWCPRPPPFFPHWIKWDTAGDLTVWPKSPGGPMVSVSEGGGTKGRLKRQNELSVNKCKVSKRTKLLYLLNTRTLVTGKWLDSTKPLDTRALWRLTAQTDDLRHVALISGAMKSFDFAVPPQKDQTDSWIPCRANKSVEDAVGIPSTSSSSRTPHY